MDEKIYPLKTSMKVLCMILAILCTILIVTIPLAVLMYMMAFRAKIVLKADRVVNTWIRTREVPYADIGGLSWGVRAGGIMGVLMGRPLHWHDKTGNKKFWGFMVEAVENSAECLAEIQTRTGQKPI